MSRQRFSPFFDIIDIAWPRILTVRRVFQANMAVAHAMGAPILAAELRSPARFPGPKPQRTDSVITVQTRLRGVPYFEGLALDNSRRAGLNLRTQSPPPLPTGTNRNGR